jgi:NADH:ubiquinone oxidoreductase subunit E
MARIMEPREVAVLELEPQADLVVKLIQEKVKDYGRSRRALIPLLQEIQMSLGYLPEWGLKLVSDSLDVPLGTIYGIATFYHQFTLEALGEYVIQLCMGTACHIRGNADNYAFLQSLLDLDAGATTTDDGLFSVLKVRCLGCCSLAPVLKVNDDIYGKVDFKAIRKIISGYRAEAKKRRKELEVFTVQLGDLKLELRKDELENLKRTGLRWSVLKCLHMVLGETRFDVPNSVESDLETVRSMIETGCRKPRDADGLLNWVESRLIEKAISLSDLDYWEDILWKAKDGKLTHDETLKVPRMEDMTKRYEFLGYCIPSKA